MARKRAQLPLILCTTTALVLNACLDSSQSPPARPEVPVDAPEAGALGPIDLVYLCGNKFLATNATAVPVQVEYRVVGTDETGNVSLGRAPEQDPGFSETELETATSGSVELYEGGRRVAIRRNDAIPCGAPAASISASAAAVGGPEITGSWSAVFPWPVVAIDASLLPNGRVLAWGLDGTPQVWNPATGSFAAVPSSDWLFCSGHSFLPDGRLLVSGGHVSAWYGIPDNNLFNPSTQTWSPSAPMRRARWYPTNITLANGDVLILAGTDGANINVQEPEIWSAGALRVLTTAAQDLTFYPRAFLAPNGKVFYAGQQRITRYLNTAGTGSWSTVANRLYPIRDYGSAVMYDVGKILYVGGGRTTNTAEIINLNQASPAWRWTGSMAFQRRHHTANVLPTGEVLVTGGSSGTGFNDFSLGVHAAEIWNPATGAWKTLASNAVNRTYHSTSLLLPDGRVLHAGSGGAAGVPDETNAELFSPPYLFKGARPTISSAPAVVRYRVNFKVTTPQAAAITKVTLIRLGSVTHGHDMNQRFQRLSFVKGSGTLTVTAPTNRNITPPGHYMLFILNGNGVPSKAKIVQVQ
jgi:hypothetical protein